jgi:predicted dehydrogenase
VRDHKPINVGLVGAGDIARAHAVAYGSARTYCGPELPPIRLLRVAEMTEELAQAAAERLGFEAWTTNWEELVESPDIDLVSVVTPNFLHAPVAIAAIEAGKHVFCEKPLAEGVEQAKRMWQAAEAAGIVHGVNFNYRKVPAVQFIKRLIHSGRIGDVRQFRAAYLQDWGNDPRIPRSWKFRASQAGGGVLLAVGSHVIDLSRYLVGELERVAATTEIWIKERPVPTSSLAFKPVQEETAMAPVDVEDSAYFLGRFVGGAIGVFEISRCAFGRKNHMALEIHGTKGSVCYNYEQPHEVQLYLNDQDDEAAGFRTILIGPAHAGGSLLAYPGIPVGFAESIVFQIRDLLSAITMDSIMVPNFYDGWRAQVVVESVLQSIDQGWVTVPPPPHVAGATES